MATAEFSKFAGILNAALSRHHLLGFEITMVIKGYTNINVKCDIKKVNQVSGES